MTFEEWIEDHPEYHMYDEYMIAEMAWNAAAKAATEVCEEQKGADADTEWNECCDYCATEIEQRLITTQGE